MSCSGLSPFGVVARGWCLFWFVRLLLLAEEHLRRGGILMRVSSILPGACPALVSLWWLRLFFVTRLLGWGFCGLLSENVIHQDKKAHSVSWACYSSRMWYQQQQKPHQYNIPTAAEKYTHTSPTQLCQRVNFCLSNTSTAVVYPMLALCTDTDGVLLAVGLRPGSTSLLQGLVQRSTHTNT